MARRWTWWIGLGFLLVMLLAFGTWRLLQEVPGFMAKAWDTVRREAEALGLELSFRDLRFHPLHLRVSLEDLDIRDGIAGIPLAHADHVEVSLSPRRFLSGLTPVSRVLVRTYSVHAGEANRPLLEKVRGSGKGREAGTLPEILLLDGKVRFEPMGPLERWEARVPEVRIRPVRFLGTRVTAAVQGAAGRIALPGAGSGNIPLESAEADFFLKGDSVRVRKFQASGRSAKLSLSGQWEGADRTVDWKFSGETDLEVWAASGAWGKDWIRRVATEGTIAFSGRIEGPVENPEGWGKILARNILFPGKTPFEGEASLAVAGKRIRLESLRGKIWEGTVSAAGMYDFRAGKGDAKLSLEQAAFGKAPWGSWGISWRPAGRGTLVLSLTGGREILQGTISLKNPAGFERPGAEGAPAARVALPLAAVAAWDVLPGKEWRIRDLRVTAGRAEATGKGAYAPDGGRLSFAGGFLVPRGRAADYGWGYPLSWGSLSGAWSVSGAAGNPHVTAKLTAEGLAARALPPVPLSLKLEGDPADVVHFVADIPVDVAKVTAVGTISGPLSSRPLSLETTVGARDIDFSLAGGWGAAVLSSLRKDPTQLKKYTAGMSGTGNADLRISVGKGVYSVSGSISSPEIRFSGIGVRAVSASGNWGESVPGVHWGFQADGRFGEGSFLLTGKGEGGESGIFGTLEDIDLGTLASFVDGDSRGRIGGRATMRLEARAGPRGWEIRKFSASVPRLNAVGLTIEQVSAEGSLGESSGILSLVSASPSLRASADIRRESGWPVSFSVRAEGVPTGTLLDAIGRKDATAKGTWDAVAEGTMKVEDWIAGRKMRPEAFSAFRFSVTAAQPVFSGVSFGALSAEGTKEDDVIVGEMGSRLPDSRLSFSLSLREPFGFRVEGPFMVGQTTEPVLTGGSPGASREDAQANGNGKARLGIAGRVQVTGSLFAPENSRGTLAVERLMARYRGMDLAGEGISIQLSSEGIRWASGTVRAAGNPLHVTGKASWAGDLDVRLDGRVPATAIRLATDVFDRLDGMTRMEVRVTGRWDDPSVIGTGRLENGTFSFRGYAQLFEQMNADAVISREKIIFEHFEGRSGGGYIDGRGELPLRFAEGQKMYFSVDFFDMRYPYPEDLRPMLQGHVELLGPLNDLFITGDVEVQSATYTKTIRLEQALLDFRKRLAEVKARRRESDFRIRLDLEVLADGTIHVKNNLGEGDIKGEFKVVGDTSRVVLLGAFDVTEARIDYRGNRYELLRGSLEFQDPRRNNPRLDFRAETKKGNVTVTVSVSGTLEKYEVDLSSDPPYSKNDIVSLLSLGVTSETLGGAGGAVSATQAAAFVLGPYTGRVEEGFRNVIGLDKFAIEPAYSSTDQSFEPRFIVGKSFGERISVSVSTNVGTTAETSSVAEFKVFENVYLQGGWRSATTTQEGDLGADVKFRYRYRQFRDIFRGGD
ncbi:MAG: translocation/assembly module TamB domain-containing protein [Candidatus Deferrimicrobiaceae bacterium]